MGFSYTNPGWGFTSINNIFSELSLLNTSSSSKFEEFNLKDIETFEDEEEWPWLKEAHLENF